MQKSIKSVAATNFALFFITLTSLLVFFMSVADVVNTSCANETIRNMDYSVFAVRVFTINETYMTTNYAIIPIGAAFIYNLIIVIKALWKQSKNKSI